MSILALLSDHRGATQVTPCSLLTVSRGESPIREREKPPVPVAAPREERHDRKARTAIRAYRDHRAFARPDAASYVRDLVRDVKQTKNTEKLKITTHTQNR